MERAECKGQTDLFFPPHTCDEECPADCQAGRSEPGRFSRISRAKELCASCPVLDDCREWALSVRFPTGFIAGMSERQRKIEIRKRERSGIVAS